MNCLSFINVLDLLAEGRLSPRRAKAVEAHLASCASCRALARPAAAPAPSAAAPLGLKEKLRAAARAGAGASVVEAAARDLPLWPREARGLALAAAALLIAGLIVAAEGVPSQSSGASVAAVEAP